MTTIIIYFFKLKMFRCILYVCLVNSVLSSDIFHVNSKTMFYSGDKSDYFGYSVVMSDMGLYVGAPKGKNKDDMGKTMVSGQAFKCTYDGFKPVGSCLSLDKVDSSIRRRRYNSVVRQIFKDDMWFGATMTYIPKGRLLICAPRVTRELITRVNGVTKSSNLANGVCIVHTSVEDKTYSPLANRSLQAIHTDGRRKEYGTSDVANAYYAYGQSGFSAKWDGGDKFIMGAPGVLQWTGSIVTYKNTTENGVFFVKLPTVNPYFIKELYPDDYFGYSVEAGVFEGNGKTLHVAGAPRSSRGYGQVLVFEPVGLSEYDPVKIKESLTGPQLGSYFGSSLCTVDLDGDGLSDLLVGASTYASGMPYYDQGAVFVYLSRQKNSKLRLEEAGFVMGSESSGAKFGTAIANLGDIDGDGHNDVAIGAPYENGTGAVYIYKGSLNGLNQQYSQRIAAEGASGFGFSISNGYDVDKNDCNDVLIGAFNSSTAYLYRCIPTIKVIASIKVPDVKELKQNGTHFTAEFCVTAPLNKFRHNVILAMKATVTIDPEYNRANADGESEYQVQVSPGYDSCNEQIIEVNNQSDLSRPISLKFELKPVQNVEGQISFPTIPRISEDSRLEHSSYLQMISDCGDDLICSPKLVLNLEALESPYVPGTDSRMKFKITVLNTEEPAYSVKVALALPCPPKRLPLSCSLRELNMTCDLPQPLNRNKTADWELELEYSWQGSDEELKVVATLEDPLYGRNVSDEPTRELILPITPNVQWQILGKSKPNSTIPVSRDLFNNNGVVSFTHSYEAHNHGPSDLYYIEANILLSQEIINGSSLGITRIEGNLTKFSPDSLLAKDSVSYELPIQFHLSRYAEELDENNILNVTSQIIVYVKYGSKSENMTMELTTTLVLEPKMPLWPLIAGIVSGLLLLAAMILGLYKFGFFSRKKKEELKQLIENTSSTGEECPSTSCTNPDSSSRELLDSDQE